MSDVGYRRRGQFINEEVNQLHADAFDHHVYDESEWDWVELCIPRSLHWFTARIDGGLVAS